MSNRVILSAEQAVSMLDDSEYIHTFRSSVGLLIGCDWSREDLIAAIEESVCELGGDSCQSMGHGLVIHTGGFPLFVECKESIDYSQFKNSAAE